MTEMVVAERVCKNFGALKVLKGVTLTVGQGSVLCIIGPSGSGKSTFLRCINHLETINAGRLYVDGELVGYRERGGKLYEVPTREAARQRRDVGMVFQHFNLFPHRTALGNIVEAPLHVKKMRKKEAQERARNLLQTVGWRLSTGCWSQYCEDNRGQRPLKSAFRQSRHPANCN